MLVNLFDQKKYALESLRQQLCYEYGEQLLMWFDCYTPQQVEVSMMFSGNTKGGQSVFFMTFTPPVEDKEGPLVHPVYIRTDLLTLTGLRSLQALVAGL